MLLALLLVAIASVNAAAGAPQTTGADVYGLSSVVSAVAIAASIACAVLALVAVIAVLRLIRRRHRDDELPPRIVDHPNGPLTEFVALSAMALLITATVLAVVYLNRHQRGGQSGRVVAPLPGRPVPGRSSSPGSASAHHNMHMDLPLAIVLVVLAVAALAFVLRRRLAARRHTEIIRTDRDRAQGDLAEAIDRAARALGAQGTPREDIIACYRAMEDGLGSVGIARQHADTPEDLLARAAELGIVLPSAARLLTELFREARFSTHPMSAEQRRHAAEALDALRLDVLASR